MRYYRYGAQDRKEFETKEVTRSTKNTGHIDRLIIEEDTIYEIDEECMECLKKEKNRAR